MGRRLVIITVILLVVLFLLWQDVKVGVADREERFLTNKILDRIDKVLEKQDLILKEIKGLKEKLSSR